MLSLSLSNISNSSRKKITQSNQAAASFDGTNDFIDASLLGPNIDKASGSISHWVKITTSANNEILFSCSDGTSGNDKIQTVFMTSTSSGQFQAVYKAGGVSNKAVYNYPAVDIVNAGWFHLAMTYTINEENALTIKLYFNGALQNTFTGTAEAIAEGVAFDRVILGRNANAENSYLTGLMDECMYFSGVLSDDQILGIYNSRGRANINRLIFLDPDIPTQATCKLWLRFGDGSIGQTKDQTTGIIDMSNPDLGSELVTNGNFATNSNWTFNSSYWNISGGTANALGVANGSFTQTLAVQSGKIYKIEIASTITSGNGIYAVKLGTTQQIFDNSTSNISLFLLASGNNVDVSIQPGNSAFSVSEVSVKEVQGHPAFVSGALINQDDNPTA